MNFLKTVICVFIVSACAKSPESIAPAYVSQNTYQPYACAELSEERQRVAAALSTASQQQSDARTNDTVGVILLGLPVSTLSGGNVAYQVADLKGHLSAIDQTMIRKRCSSGGVAQPTAIQPTIAPKATTAPTVQPVVNPLPSTVVTSDPKPKAGKTPLAEPVQVVEQPQRSESTVAQNTPAPRRSGVQPLPKGQNVAKPVGYTSEEILVYCRQGWDSRPLTNGKIEYNPCFYR